jgi:hypothetical protein
VIKSSCFINRSCSADHIQADRIQTDRIQTDQSDAGKRDCSCSGLAYSKKRAGAPAPHLLRFDAGKTDSAVWGRSFADRLSHQG